MKILKNINNKYSRRIVSVVMAIVLFVSFIGIFPDVLKTNALSTDYVIKFAKNRSSGLTFGQFVSLNPNKYYVLSYYYTKGINPGGMVRNTDGETIVKVSTRTFDSEWSKINLKFKANTDTEDDRNIAGNKLMWVGIYGTKNATEDSYFYGLTLYDVDNPEVNLLKDSDLSESGTSFSSVWKELWKGKINTSSYSKVTLESIGGMDYFKLPHMALKLEPESTGSPWFGQKVSLDPNKEYVFTYYYTQGYNAYGYAVNYNSETYATTYQETNDVEWSKYNLKFKPNESADDDTNIPGNKLMWVGLRGQKASVPLYYYGFNLYDVENPSVNLLQDPYLANGSGIDTTIWKSPYGTNIKSSFSKASLDTIGGIEFFKKPSMVLRLEAGATGMPFFGQAVSVDPTKTYVFSYYYTHGFDPNVRVYDNLTETTVTDYSISYDDDWAKVNIEFKANSTAPDDTNIEGNKIVWVGLRGQKASTPLYFYGLNLYEVGNAGTNLLRDPNLLQNGNSIDKTVWKSPYGTAIKSSFSKVSLESIGGVEFFKKPPMVLKLEAGTTGQPFFGQAVSVDPTKTYVFSYYYTHGFDPIVRVYDNLTETAVTDYSISYDDDWAKVNIEFKANSTAPDDTNIEGNKIVWVGLRGQKASTPLYFYGLNLYEVGNAGTNLLQDPNLLQNGNSIDTTVWKSPYGTAIKSTYSKVELDSIGGMDYFKIIEQGPNVLKLEPNTTGMPFFGQFVSLDPTKDYAFTYYYTSGISCNAMALFANTETSVSDFETTYDHEWSKVKMEFSIPENAPDDTVNIGNKLLWVGLRGVKSETALYYYGFNLYEVNNPEENLLKDSNLLQNGSGIDRSLWKSPYSTAIKSSFSEVSLESIGGVDYFKRIGSAGPKMMYYTRTERGPNHETYGCFSFVLPNEMKTTGANYVFEFDARSTKGRILSNFRCSTLDSALKLDDNGKINPASIEGYTFSFNLRIDKNTAATKKITFLIFVPEGAEGYISNLRMFKADDNFNKISTRNMLSSSFGDFSQYEEDSYVGLYTIQGGCIGTDTGKLSIIPEYFFEIPPDVPVPEGEKMISYASVWGAGTIRIDLPYTVEKGSADGKNYIVSIDIRPVVGRDPSKFYTTGINGESVQVFPTSTDGYTYTFYLIERYNFSLTLEFPINCEGYLSNLKMFEADSDFAPINKQNVSTAFGAGGDFSAVFMQAGMKWSGISFDGGFANTFIDTRSMAEELKNGTIGEYHASGALWPIPTRFFVAEKDENWAGDSEFEEEETGKIIGTLYDASGKAVKNCTVVLTSMQDFSDVRKAVPDKNGKFTFEKVPVGGYDVSIITESGEEIYGDDSVWIEENNDVVTLSLTYVGGSLDMDYESIEGEESIEEENRTEEAGNKSEDKKSEANNDTSDNGINVWIIVLICGGLTIVIVAFFLVRKKIKSKSKVY